MIPRQISSKELRKIRRILKSHRGTIAALAKELGVKLPSVSLWLTRGYGLSADKGLRIQERAAELPELPDRPKDWRPKPDPQKQSVWSQLNRAVREGKLAKPNTCELCGALPSGTGPGRALHAHHNDYSRPLEVVWLCSACHQKLHAKRDRQPRGLKAAAMTRQKTKSKLAFQEYLSSKNSLTANRKSTSPVSLRSGN